MRTFHITLREGGGKNKGGAELPRLFMQQQTSRESSIVVEISILSLMYFKLRLLPAHEGNGSFIKIDFERPSNEASLISI